jgi:uncharacterized Zn-finger protein
MTQRATCLGSAVGTIDPSFVRSPRMPETIAKTTPSAVREVTRDDLPLSCPMPGDELWSMHPRVYLPIEKTGEAICPYCGARYRLRD